MARRALQGGPRWARGWGLFLGPRSGGSVFSVTGDAVQRLQRLLVVYTRQRLYFRALVIVNRLVESLQ